MSRSIAVETGALFGLGLFLLGGIIGSIGSSSVSSTYNTECSDLYESRTVNYTGSIDEYGDTGLETDLFFSPVSGEGGVFLMSSDKMAVENDSILEFQFTQKTWLECEEGEIQVDTSFVDEQIVSEDAKTKTGDIG